MNMRLQSCFTFARVVLVRSLSACLFEVAQGFPSVACVFVLPWA